MLDEQRAVAQQLDAGAAVQGDGLELGDAGTCLDQRGETERRQSVSVCADSSDHVRLFTDLMTKPVRFSGGL